MMKILIALLLSIGMASQAHAEQYLKCFRDEGGVLHEVQDRMPDTPPPTIPIVPRSETPPPPPTPTTTLPPLSFNYTPQLHWRLHCSNDISYGPFMVAADCQNQRSWVQRHCPLKRVDRTHGFASADQIRLFRQGCGADNGTSCVCQPEYY